MNWREGVEKDLSEVRWARTQLWGVDFILPSFPKKPWDIMKFHDFSLIFIENPLIFIENQ